MIDLIETKQIKSEIEKNPENVLNIIEKTDLGICITDSNGNYAAVNNAYCRIYEYKKEELIGKSFTIVVPGTEEQMNTLHQKFLRDKKEILREWDVVTRNGKTIHISVDAGYSDKIFNKGPHKITFVQPEE